MAILKFLPYESFYIVTKLQPDVVQARLQHELTFNDTGTSYANTEPDTFFRGFAGKGKFSIIPYVNYRNYFLPKIKGTIEADNGGSRVHVTSNVPASTSMFMAIGMIIMALACATVIVMAWRTITFKTLQHYLSNFNPLTLIPFLVLILGQLFAFAAFKQESRKARKILLELFEGTIE